MNIEEYTNWNRRASDDKPQIEPFRKYVFICEGTNSEVWYFKKLIDQRKVIGVHPLIDIRLWEKKGRAATISAPSALIKFAREQKQDKSLSFDCSIDRMVVVFDADIFERKNPSVFNDIIAQKEANEIYAVTNPCFELFLLLHIDNSYENIIQPNYKQLLENKKIGNRRYAEILLSEKTGVNSKKNPKGVARFVELLETAITQEKNINQNEICCRGYLTCNIGKIINEIREVNPLD